MRASRINHVSVHANDLEESARFYEDVFSMERIATPRFPHTNVLWLRLGDQQFHLFQHDGEAPKAHHFGVDVDDFEAVYVRAKERGHFDSDGYYASVWEHPAGWVQMYVRDPAGNLVEVDWPDASSLDRSVVTGIRRLDEVAPQEGEAAIASLYLVSRAAEPV